MNPNDLLYERIAQNMVAFSSETLAREHIPIILISKGAYLNKLDEYGVAMAQDLGKDRLLEILKLIISQIEQGEKPGLITGR
jgi:hypothetical protein